MRHVVNHGLRAALHPRRTGNLRKDLSALIHHAGLEPGACRELTQTETAALYAAVDLDPDREE
jgi:hypothetical protein